MRTSQIKLKQFPEREKIMATLEVIRKEDNDFIVKVPGKQDPVRIEDTYAEMYT